MSKKSTHPRRRSRSGVGILATFTTTFVTLITMLIVSVGSASAAPTTQTAWIPLECFVAGAIPTHVAAALTATVPSAVTPTGDDPDTGATETGFNLLNVHTTVTFPGASQVAGGSVFGSDVDFVQGIVQDFETNLTGATVNFANTAGGGVTQVDHPDNQFNSVFAVQPPNATATGNARINGGDTTRNGFQPSTPLESFSFGNVPVDVAGNGPDNVAGNADDTAYGPAPGVGGDFGDTSAGTPDNLPPIGPMTVTGNVGDTIVIKTANPGGPPANVAPPGSFEDPRPKVADNTISFRKNHGTNPGAPADDSDDTWTNQTPADCGVDVTTDAVPSPNADFVAQFEIPIVAGAVADGVGSASARGTDPDASLGTGTVAAQFSAVANCDETADTRPFIVRWTEGNTTNTFRRTSTDTSTCVTESGTKVNEGTGAGTINGSTAATVEWSFVDGVPSPDNVNMTITPDTGSTLDIAGAPQALSGTPGGVWAHETSPWPAGGGV